MNTRIKLVLWRGVKGTFVEGMLVLMSYDEKQDSEKKWSTDRVGAVLVWFCNSWYDFDRFSDNELTLWDDEWWMKWDNGLNLRINDPQGLWEHASEHDIECDHEWEEVRV